MHLRLNGGKKLETKSTKINILNQNVNQSRKSNLKLSPGMLSKVSMSWKFTNGHFGTHEFTKNQVNNEMPMMFKCHVNVAYMLNVSKYR